MVMRLILFGLLVLLGLSAVVLGFKGVQNKRLLNGLVFIAVGLACIGFSGLRIYEEVRNVVTDERIIETRALLKEVQNRQRQTEASRSRFEKQLGNELAGLKALDVSGVAIADRVHTDPQVRALVERIALLNRWIAMCDEQLEWDSKALQAYENILFYYDNLQIVGSLQFDASKASAATIDLDKVVEEAKQQPMDDRPLEISPTELQTIIDALAAK